jgi:hypothetical protein
MQSIVFAVSAFAIVLWFPRISLSEEVGSNTVWLNAPSVYVEVDTKTWKTRGRLYWDVKGSMIKKLAETGFGIVRNKEAPHDLTLKVFYQEDRGEQYSINAYGTVIRCTFLLETLSTENPWKVNISESSTNVISGIPPYLDVLDKFQTNPYYFFIGEILRGNLENGLDPRGGLIYALKRILAIENTKPKEGQAIGRDAGSHLHTMFSDSEFYKTEAIRRAIDDCVDAKDRRIIPVFSHLLNHRESAVRLRTIEAIGSFGAEGARPLLLQMAQNDPDAQVRETAKSVGEALAANKQSQDALP